MDLLIFDIDGTLVDSNEIDRKCFENSVYHVLGDKFSIDSKVLELFEFETDTELAMKLFMHHKGRYPRTYELNQVKNNLIQCFESFTSANGNFIQIPGARQLFRELKNSDDIALSIATGSWKISAEYKLDSTDIRWRYVPLISADKFRNKFEIINEARIQSRVYYGTSNFKREIYFGDKDWDERAAKKLGMKFINVDKTLNSNSIKGLSSFPNMTELMELFAEYL
ncbi:MAG: HAD hydrolase-like protein [Chitinophagales bacterium]|nr:HAD hydrolase-like protein [Chitinophagales bacterium]